MFRQAFYFRHFISLWNLKKEKKQKKTTYMSMAEWVGGSSCEMNHTFHSVLWKSCFKHAYNYCLLQWLTGLPCSTVHKDLLVFWGCKSIFGTQIVMWVMLSMHTWAGRVDKETSVQDGQEGSLL